MRIMCSKEFWYTKVAIIFKLSRFFLEERNNNGNGSQSLKVCLSIYDRRGEMVILT